MTVIIVAKDSVRRDIFHDMNDWVKGFPRRKPHHFEQNLNPQRLFVKSHGQHMGVPIDIEEIRGEQAVRFIRLGSSNRSNFCSVSQGQTRFRHTSNQPPFSSHVVLHLVDSSRRVDYGMFAFDCQRRCRCG